MEVSVLRMLNIPLLILFKRIRNTLGNLQCIRYVASAVATRFANSSRSPKKNVKLSNDGEIVLEGEDLDVD